LNFRKGSDSAVRFGRAAHHHPHQQGLRRDNQVVALANAVGKLRFFGKKSQMVRRDFSPVVPETFTMVDGLQVPLSEISVRFPRGVRFVCNACGAARETKH